MRQLVIMLFAAAAVFVGTPFSAPALAQTAPAPTPEAVDRLYRCADIAEAEARLACFDEAVAVFRTAQTGGELAVVDRAQVEQVEREAFGFSLPSLPRLAFGRDGDEEGDGLEEVPMTIADVRTRNDGRAVFTMTNGQRWVQVEAQRTFNVREGDEIVIRRAALGSFFLSPEAGAAHRVRRME